MLSNYNFIYTSIFNNLFSQLILVYIYRKQIKYHYKYNFNYKCWSFGKWRNRKRFDRVVCVQRIERFILVHIVLKILSIFQSRAEYVQWNGLFHWPFQPFAIHSSATEAATLDSLNWICGKHSYRNYLDVFVKITKELIDMCFSTGLALLVLNTWIDIKPWIKVLFMHKNTNCMSSV